MNIKCVVACFNASGEPDFYFCKVDATEQNYNDGEHYEMAEEAAKRAGYEGPYVAFDENDGPAWLFERFVWKSATTFVE
ncbi:MAG: hypothetical protein EBZ69_00305 [Alphaproteobacteria bacterium]|nr:hypothetical protein [Alphaproteobacteria bacterium]